MRCRGSSSRDRGARRSSITSPDTLQSYDAVIFFTYLYAPTVLGLQIAPERSILAPTAHNEPAIHLGIYKELFQRPEAIAFNTEVEKAFLKSDIRHPRGSRGNRGMRRRSARRSYALRAQPRRNGLPEGPFLLYGGRIDAGKGCDQLLDFFDTYKEEGGPATLVLMGAKLMPLPDVPWVRYAGLLSEADRLRALEAATIVVVPSPFESLSLLALEGMAVGNPGPVQRARRRAGRSLQAQQCRPVLFQPRGIRGVHRTCCSPTGACASGWAATARRTSTANYSWDVIMAKYDKLMAALPKRMNAHRSSAESSFAAIFLTSFGIYVMRASNSGGAARAARDRRRPRLRRDRLQRLAGARIRL